MATVFGPDVITCKYAGIDLTQGIGKGGFIEISKSEDDWTVTHGLGGDAVLNKIPGGSTIVKVTLLQTSSANILMSAYHAASRAIDGGGPAPFVYKDRLGNSEGIETDAVIQKMPDEKFDKEVDDVTWAIICPALKRVVGGH